jgi:outer membrane protein assembly factor BamB
MHTGQIGRLALVLGLALWLGSNGRAADWPRFRGPNGTGISTDKNIPIQWSPENDVLWKTRIPGIGNSSPIVWGNRVFLQSASADGKERRLLCLNLADGGILWSVAVPGSHSRTHERNTLASSTPATDGERVYAVFWDGEELTLCAYDFQGQLLWKRGLGAHKSQHGAGISPTVYRGKVFLANDQDGASMVVALDAKSGNPVWEAPRRPFRACYSTPFLLEKAGQEPGLIVASTAGVTSYQPETGQRQWDWSWPFSGMALRTVASPIFSQGLIFANSGDGKGDRATIALRLEDTEAGPKPTLAWEKKREVPYVPCMLAWGDHLYYVFDKGFAGCCSAKTGERIWYERLGGEVTASPVLIDGKVYAINEQGTVFVFAASPTFQLLAKNAVGEWVRASPAVADNRLLIRGEKHLFCIGKAATK